MPTGAVYVGRPTVFGNPFRVGDPHPWHHVRLDRAMAVQQFRHWLARGLHLSSQYDDDNRRAMLTAGLRELRCKDLACWCPLDEACHADVLLEEANRG